MCLCLCVLDGGYLGFIALSGFSYLLPVLLLHLVHLPLMFPLYLLALVSKEAAEL